MKSISIILASILCAGAPVVAEEKAEAQTTIVQQESRFKLGSEAIQEIRAKYQAGAYDEFLSEMDESYQSAKENNELEGLIEIRKEAGNYSISVDKLIDGFEAIQQEKNTLLLKAVSNSKDSILGQKVLAAAAQLPSGLQDATVELSQLRSKAPGTGSNADENKLIEIDLENHYKVIHLDSLAARGEKILDRKDKHFVLDMQKMDQMLAASAKFEDKDLKSLVETAAASYDLRLSKTYDLSDLNDLARGRVKPQSDMEEKVASIVADAHSKFSDLNRDLLDEVK